MTKFSFNIYIQQLNENVDKNYKSVLEIATKNLGA